MNKYFFRFGIFFSLIISLRCSTIATTKITPQEEDEVHNICNYPSISKSTDLINRTGTIPDRILNYFRKLDKRPNYEQYVPNDSEIEIINKTFAELPNGLQKTLKARLIGWFFISDFASNGATLYVSDNNGNKFAFILIHPRNINETVSSILTKRDKTIFFKGKINTKIQINIKGNYHALQYILMHESSHVADLAFDITPFHSSNGSGILKQKYNFSHWKSEYYPKKEYDSRIRSYITFYGFRDGPYLADDYAVPLYEYIESSVFASAYASQSILEDFAELVSFGFLCSKPNSCAITVTNDFGVYRYAIMKNKKVQSRYKSFDSFLHGKFNVPNIDYSCN